MGNSSTKEQRPSHGHHHSNGCHRGQSDSSSARPTDDLSLAEGSDRVPPPTLHHSGREGSRVDFAMLGLTASSSASHGRERDPDRLEGRKETKAERDARRLERDRILRAKERERSMREESVDGGFLVTQGVYTGLEDFSKSAVRQLMVRSSSFPIL